MAKRRAISLERRLHASQSLSAMPFQGAVLSFASLPEEINTWPLNRVLLEEDRLYLPKVMEQELGIFKVERFAHLYRSSWGILEPDPEKCSLIAPAQIDCALIPGLGFDLDKRRLGYGKGHYDRLLGKLKLKVGVAFQEQLVEGDLPWEPHDQPVDALYLF